MSRATRVLDKQLEKAVSDRARTILQTGLPMRPSRIDLLALARKLGEVCKSPSALAERLFDVFERSARPGAPVERLACKKGCAYCCHGMVAITAPEAFALAARVRQDGPDAVARFRERATAVAGKSASERLGAKLPCPLLGTDGACTVYTVRPLACRRVVAFELKPCLEEFEGQDGEIVVPAHYNAHAANVLVALAAALADARQPLAHYEFSSAVLRVLDTVDAEARWRRGDDVFAGLRREDIGDAVDEAAAALRE